MIILFHPFNIQNDIIKHTLLSLSSLHIRVSSHNIPVNLHLQIVIIVFVLYLLIELVFSRVVFINLRKIFHAWIQKWFHSTLVLLNKNLYFIWDNCNIIIELHGLPVINNELLAIPAYKLVQNGCVPHLLHLNCIVNQLEVVYGVVFVEVVLHELEIMVVVGRDDDKLELVFVGLLELAKPLFV